MVLFVALFIGNNMLVFVICLFVAFSRVHSIAKPVVARISHETRNAYFDATRIVTQRVF